jgi:hypothetical protein
MILGQFSDICAYIRKLAKVKDHKAIKGYGSAASALTTFKLEGEVTSLSKS